MLYLIGLGLNDESFSKEAEKIILKTKKVFIENYTIKFPYQINKLEKKFNKKILIADREFIESLKILKEAEKENVVLLVYGSPFFATTHISLINEAKKAGIKTKVLHNSSVFDALGNTGLQLYKFGKITSIPKWTKNFKPTSFIDIIKENLSINAHTLILVDVGLNFKDAIYELEESAKEKKLEIKDIVVCSAIGTKNEKILYSNIKSLKNKKIKEPFCFIIPTKLHFVEEENLKNFKF
ncbi:MAG: diphthine synthase [Candidatus Pacearchaeota archaeon]|nr:MAG: diphthine synthase [Candidatus Pacearchaeota archaeon]